MMIPDKDFRQNVEDRSFLKALIIAIYKELSDKDAIN